LLTVSGIGVDYIQIRDRPKGQGTVIGDRTYFVREQDVVYAATYNRTLGYRGDAPADWTSNDSVVCKVNAWGAVGHGSSAEILFKYAGTCAITLTAYTVSGQKTNVTGTLTVTPRTLVTVDDSGGKDFMKIQDAVDFAQAGYTVFVYDGTYPEHVVVSKGIEIVGETRHAVVLDGSGSGTALRITGDRAVVHNLTIQNAAFGVFLFQSNNTRLYDLTIQ